MKFRTTIIILLLASGLLHGQDRPPRYKLEPGDRYFLEQKLSQTTRTEDGNLAGNVSLDISNTLSLEVTLVTAGGNYLMNCTYKSLELDFFAPQADIALSSSNSAFIPIKSYLNTLQESSFTVLMSAHGAFLEVRGLDSIINNLVPAETNDAEATGGDEQVKKRSERAESEDLVRKTIHDAFGARALTSTANIALNFYDDTSMYQCVKQTEVLFNGRPVKITNNLYFRTLDDHARRVQGVGVIGESNATLEMNDMLLVTSLKGNQTYDFLCDLPSGWIREGMSKQKIHSLSGVRNHDELPEGLKIPSVTESEYRFRGGKITQ